MFAMRHTLSIAAFALMTSVAGLAGADAVYKWVDEKGVTHYGEKAPQGAKSATPVKIGDTTSSDADTELKKLNDRRAAAAADAKKKDEDAARKPASTPSAEDKAKATSACDQHRKNLETLKSGKNVRALGEDGKQRALSEQEIADQIKFAEGELQRCQQLQQLQDATNQAPPAPTR